MPSGRIYDVVNAMSSTPILLVCEHAGNYIPRSYNNLGLGKTEINSHIAWDIGAKRLTLRLAETLSATSILHKVSRLVVDCNRHPSSSDIIPTRVANIDIPGNMNLSTSDFKDRLESFFYPFHGCLQQMVRSRLALGMKPIVVPIHSFTRTLAGRERDFDIGILFEAKTASVTEVTNYVRAHSPFACKENQPYSARMIKSYTLHESSRCLGAEGFAFEVRNDILEREYSFELTAKAISAALENCEGLYSSGT